MDHGLCCECRSCLKLWSEQEDYDAANQTECGEENINYEDEKELDQVMDFQRD